MLKSAKDMRVLRTSDFPHDPSWSRKSMKRGKRLAKRRDGDESSNSYRRVTQYWVRNISVGWIGSSKA